MQWDSLIEYNRIWYDTILYYCQVLLQLIVWHFAPETHTLVVLTPQTVQRYLRTYFFSFLDSVHRCCDDYEFLKPQVVSDFCLQGQCTPTSTHTQACTHTPCKHGSPFLMYNSGGRWGFMAHNHHLSLAASGLAVWVWLSNPQLEL